MQYKPIFSIRYLHAGQVRTNIQARQPLGNSQKTRIIVFSIHYINFFSKANAICENPIFL
jgi:hypothetical protein